MSILLYEDHEGHYHEQELSAQQEVIRIGSDPDQRVNDIVLPASSGILPRHAVLLRSSVNHLPVLMALPGALTRVNGRAVVGVQVLRQKDALQLGETRMTFWEICITVATVENRTVGQNCLVCLRRIQTGDEIVICPRCSTAGHRLCWFSLDVCPAYACNYPIQEGIVESLALQVIFERSLTPSSELLRKRQKCRAGNRSDEIGFLEGDDIVYCPSESCRTPFHISCWLNLERCTVPTCGYEIQKLLETVFSFTNTRGRQSGEVTT